MLRRLGRIEALDRQGAPPHALLDEVSELLAEGEAWLRAEAGDTGRAARALERCRAKLEGRIMPV